MKDVHPPCCPASVLVGLRRLDTGVPPIILSSGCKIWQTGHARWCPHSIPFNNCVDYQVGLTTSPCCAFRLPVQIGHIMRRPREACSASLALRAECTTSSHPVSEVSGEFLSVDCLRYRSNARGELLFAMLDVSPGLFHSCNGYQDAFDSLLSRPLQCTR